MDWNSFYPAFWYSYNAWPSLLWGGIPKTKRYKETQTRNERLEELEKAALDKAEFSDGKPGFSFQDQADMAYGLGCKMRVKEGIPIFFGHYPNAFYISSKLGSETITEEQVWRYLGRKK